MQEVEKEILEMKAAGKTKREITEYFGSKDKYVVKEWVRRYNRRMQEVEAGIVRRRGRQPKGYVSTEQEKDNEIHRLKLENELLWDFRRLAGRK